MNDFQANLASSAFIAGGIALVLAFSVLGFATRSLVATCLATLAIFCVLISTLAALILMGWELGILESMCLAILVGISCDFVVHLAHAYMVAGPIVDADAYLTQPGASGGGASRIRRERVRWALATMGISVFSAGCSTMVAAFALYWGVVEFFHAFGTFLMCTLGFALLFSLVGFATAAMVLGPTTHKGRRGANSSQQPGTEPEPEPERLSILPPDGGG